MIAYEKYADMAFDIFVSTFCQYGNHASFSVLNNCMFTCAFNLRLAYSCNVTKNNTMFFVSCKTK